mgnify:CR=1 FL=1
MDSCFIWYCARTHDGYGQKRINGVGHYTHRLAYEGANGPIPEGMFVLHRYDTPPCCNPDHLFLGTKKDNTHDMIAKGHSRGQKDELLEMDVEYD